MPEAQTIECDLPNCPPGADGKCSKGIALDSCTVRNARKASQEGLGMDEVIHLPAGEELDTESARCITADRLTRLIVLAGEAKSGKTTLLASLYEKFNDGPFAGYLFAGSKTLFGWERRCHLARVPSGRTSPETERTLVGNIGEPWRLLHLRVRPEDLRSPARDVLFSDISAEVFRAIRNSTSECKRQVTLCRADHLVVVIDGAKLVDLALRHEAFHNPAMMLRSCCETGMVTTRSYVDVVISKYDEVRGAADPPAAQQYVDFVQAEFRRRFDGALRRLRFFATAARPRTEVLPYGYGLDSCFPSWVEETPLFGRRPSLVGKAPSGAREFDTYAWRRLPNRFEER
jgi:hypothetical protein